MKIRETTNHGCRYWVADLGLVDGKRVRKQFASRDAAESFLRSESRQVKAHGEQTYVPRADREEYLSLTARLAPFGVTLPQVVDYYIEHQPRKIRTIAECIAECVIAKRVANRRERYVVKLGGYLRMFARGRESAPIASITTADIETWFAARGERNGTLASNLGRLSALFTLARRRGYVSANPCDNIERVRVDHGAPKILSVDECERLLNTCLTHRPKLLGYVTLCLFAGVRPEECGKLDWASVDLAQRRVVIDYAKTRRRRIADLSDNAVAWLSQCERKGLVAPWTCGAIEKRIVRLRTLAAISWCQDILRHTAASMWMAKRQDAGYVANQLGNSPAVLLTNYRALVTPEDCARFWALTPPQ